MSTKLSANDNHSTSNSLNAENFDIPESVNITKSKQLDKNKLERKEKNKNLHLKSILSLVSQGAARAISDEKNDDERSLNARRKTPYFTSSNPSKQKKWRSNGAKELNKPLTNQSVKIKADSTIPKKDIDFVVAVLNELYDIEKNNNQLPKIISALKGITIRLGPMIEKSYEGAAAVYNDKTNTITLDLNKISQLGLTVRQVLVHEALHARDDLQAEQTGRSSIGDTETKTHQIEMMYGAQLIKKGFIKTPFVKKLSIDPIAGDHVHPFNEAELLNNVLNDILERQSQPDGVKTVWYSLDQQDKQAYIQEASKRLLEMQQSTLNILAAQHYQMEGNADSIPQRLENLKALKNQLLRLIDQQGMTPARKKYLDQLNNSIDVYTAQDGRQRRYESIWERRADILKKGDDSKRNQDDSTKLKYNSTKKISDLKNLISTASDPAKKAAYLDLLSNYEKFLSGKVADPRKTLALPLSSDDLPLNASLLMMEEQPGYIRMYISLVDANYDGKQKELHLDSNGDVIIKQKSKDGFINFSFGTPARSLAWQQKYRLDPNPKGTPTYTPIRSVLVKTDFVREYFGNYMESEHSQRDALKAKMLPDGSEITLTSVDRKIENQIGIKFKNNQSFQSILNENIWKGSFQTIALAGYEQALYDPARDGEFVDIKALERKIGFGDRKYLLDFEKTNSDGSKKYLPATPFTKIDQDSNGKFTGGHLSSSETASLYNSSLDFFTKLEQLRDGTAQKQPWYQNDQTRSEFESKLIRILEINHITPGSLVSPTTPDPRYRNGEGNSFNKSRWEAQFANQYLSHQVSQSQIFDLAGKFSQKLDTKTLNNLSEQAYIRSDLAAVRKLVPELTDSDADLLKKLLTGQLTEALLNNQELKALRIQLFFHSLRPAAGEIDSKFRNDPTISHDIGSSNAHIVEINNRKNKIDPYRILNANPSDVEYYDGSYVIKDDKLQSHNQFEPDTQQSTTEYMQNLDAPFTGGISGTTRDISRVYQSLFGNITLQQYWQFQLANAAFMIRNGYHSFFETLYVAARYAPDGDNGIGKEIITIFDRLNQQGELGEKPQGAIYQEVMNKILPIVNDGIDTNSRLTMPPYPGENSRERLVSWNQFRDEGVVKLMATNGVNDKVRLAPQSLYVGLSQSSLPKGRCSGLTEAYLQMLSQGNGVESKNKLFDTLFTHSAIYQRVKDGTVSQQEINEAAKFTNLIDDLHRSNQLAPADNSLKLIGELGIKHIVKKLSDSGDQYLMLNTGNHSLAVAKKGEKYYLYDPNFGDVEVKSSSDLTRVLKKHFNLSFTSQGNKNLAELYQTQLSADKKPVFTVYALDTQNSKVVEKTTILSQFINSDRLMTERDRLMQLGEAEIDGTKIHWTTLYDMGASLNGKRLMAADVQKLQQTGRFDQLQFDRALLGEFVTQRVQTLDHSLSSTAQWLKKVVNQREDSKSLLTNLTEGQNTTIADDFLTSVKQYINNQLNVDPEFWQSLTNKVKTNSHLATANSVSSKVGKGLQGYGYYQNIMGIFNALRRSNQPGVDQSEINKEVGLAAGGLATDLLEPLAEKGLQKAGLSLVNRFGQSASTAGKFASKLGTGLMRAGGAVLGVLTSGFDIYSAVDSFKKLASETDPKKRQDLIVNGSLSVSGAVVGIATAVAIGIGGTAAAVAGPIGVAVAAVLAIGGQIYNAVRQVEELEKWTKLSSREKFDAGFAAFFGIPQRESIMKRVVEGQARDNIDGELAKQGAAQIYNSDLDTIAYSKGKVKVDVERKYYIQVGYWVDDWASDLGGSFKYNNVQHNLTKQEAEQYLKANASRLKESYGQSSDFVSVSMLESVSDRKYNPSLHETDDDIDLSDEIKGSAETKMFQIDTDGQNSKMVKEVTSYEETYRVKTGTKLVGNKAPRVVDVYETRTRTVTPKHNLKATVYNNAGENAAVIQSVENDDKKSAFINLGAGKDKAKGFINKNNIFVVGEGEKTFTGGKKDDAFIISGSRAPNKVSQLTAGEGNDTVIAQGDLTDRTEDTGYKIDLQQGEVHYRGSSKKVATMSGFENAIGQAKTADELIGNDQTNTLNGNGGGDTLKAGGGNDILFLHGGDYAEGGQGIDTYYITRSKGEVTVKEEAVLTEVNALYLDYDINEMRAARLEGNDILMDFTGENNEKLTLRLKDAYKTLPNGTKQLQNQFSIVTRDGFLVVPEWTKTISSQHPFSPVMAASFVAAKQNPDNIQQIKQDLSGNETKVQITNKDGSVQTLITPEFIRLIPTGWQGDDVMVGGNRDDVFMLDQGNDQATGNQGQDTYIIGRNGDTTANPAEKVINNIATPAQAIDTNNQVSYEQDYLVLAGVRRDKIRLSREGDDLLVKGLKDNGQEEAVRLQQFFKGEAYQHISIVDEKGGQSAIEVDEQGNAVLSNSAVIFGTDNADNLYTTEREQGSYTLLGEAGDDRLQAKHTFKATENGYEFLDGDILVGGKGNDTLRDSWADDVLFSGEDNDIIVSSLGDDQIDTGTGRDEVRFAPNAEGIKVVNTNSSSEAILWVPFSLTEANFRYEKNSLIIEGLAPKSRTDKKLMIMLPEYLTNKPNVVLKSYDGRQVEPETPNQYSELTYNSAMPANSKNKSLVEQERYDSDELRQLAELAALSLVVNQTDFS